MLCLATDNPTNREIRAAIRFHQVKHMRIVEVYRGGGDGGSGAVVQCVQRWAKKVVDAHTFTKQPEEVQTNAVRKLMPTVFWDRLGVLAGGGIHPARDHNNATSVVQKYKKNCIEPFRTKGMEC
jgi:hypothetical protein